MDTEQRPTGIEGVGAKPWGTHFSLFYRARDDLLDLLIPYFKAGLENQEFCLYIASEPLITEEAEQAFQAALPHFERYLAEGQIEIVSYANWYLTGGHFDPLRARQSWLDSLDQAQARGYAGIRFLGTARWLQREDWDTFAAYEEQLDEVFSGLHIIALCAYALARRSAADVFDVVRHHQFTLVQRDGTWEPLHGSELRRAHDEIRKLNTDLERRIVERTAQLASANEQLRAEIAERQRAQEAAQEGQRRWQALFDGSIDAIMLWDDQWQVVDANPAACALLGYSREELLSKAASDLAPKLAPEVQRAFAQQLLSTGKLRGEYTVVRKGGTTREVHYRLLANFRPGLHIGVFHDITERKQAEAALRESEQRFSKAFHFSPTTLAITRLADGRILDVNEAFLRLYGFERGEVSGQTTLDLNIYVDPQVRPGLLQTLQEGRPVRGFEMRVRTKSGAILDILLYSELIELAGETCVLAAAIDITERKRAEETIRLQSARAQLLADVSRVFSEVGLDYEEVLKTVARQMAEAIGDACVVTLFSDDRQRAFPVALHHPNANAFALMREALLHTWDGGTNTDRFRSLMAGEAMYLPEVDPEAYRAATEPEFWPYLDQVGVSSVLVVPIQVQGDVIGTLGLTRDRPGHPYTPDDLLLLQELADRAALTIQNARLFRVVHEHRNQLRVLSAHLVEAQEAERRHLARELHDEIGQVLTALRIMLQHTRRSAADGVQDSLDEAQQLVGQLMDQIQDLSLDLRPTMLDDLGLVPALVSLIERYTQRTGIQVQFEQRGAQRRFAPAVETAAYRIVQEALTNVARHAGVHEAAVNVGLDNGLLSLQIEDAGVGFDAAAAIAAPTSSGLSGMRERADLLGGELTIESAPGGGTQITVELPLEAGGERQSSERHDLAGG